MEDLDRGAAPWSHWGGLNDLMNRSQLVDYGLASRGDNFRGYWAVFPLIYVRLISERVKTFPSFFESQLPFAKHALLS